MLIGALRTLIYSFRVEKIIEQSFGILSRVRLLATWRTVQIGCLMHNGRFDFIAGAPEILTSLLSLLLTGKLLYIHSKVHVSTAKMMLSLLNRYIRKL